VPKTVGQRVLDRAVEKLGERKLVVRLQISHSMLRAYLRGQYPVPDVILLRAVDVVMDNGNTQTVASPPEIG
jgi:hypothetical protein